MAKWTEASEEVNEFIANNKFEKMMTDYLTDNKKKWSFFTGEKDKEPIKVIEQFFDMDYFRV